MVIFSCLLNRYLIVSVQLSLIPDGWERDQMIADLLPHGGVGAEDCDTGKEDDLADTDLLVRWNT